MARIKGRQVESFHKQWMKAGLQDRLSLLRAMMIRIAVPSDPLCVPLVRALRRLESFDIQTGVPDATALHLRRREVEVAYVSPLEYARESSEYRIIPGFALSSTSGIVLRFRQGMRTIRTMAADPARVSEIVLAQIVLREQFESQPAIIPVLPETPPGAVDADSQLIVGGQAQEAEVGNQIDLAEEWTELVGLPYVHGVLCAREGALSEAAFNRLVEGDPGGVAASDAEMMTDTGERLQPMPRELSFRMTADTEEGLMEFLRYAHYHGMIRDIPSVQYLKL